MTVDLMFLDQKCPNLITFARISPKFVPILPQKNFLGVAAASPAPTALGTGLMVWKNFNFNVDAKGGFSDFY